MLSGNKPLHYLSKCWPRSIWPYGITGPQWHKWWALHVLTPNTLMNTSFMVEYPWRKVSCQDLCNHYYLLYLRKQKCSVFIFNHLKWFIHTGQTHVFTKFWDKTFKFNLWWLRPLEEFCNWPPEKKSEWVLAPMEASWCLCIISELAQHWFSWWIGTWWIPSLYVNQCLLIVNWGQWRLNAGKL